MSDQHLHKETKKFKVGKKVLNFLITEANRRKLSRYRKDKARTRMIRLVSREKESHLDDILQNTLKHITPVTQPPVLISQVQHSGGSLLIRLFDGHPEVHALPHEIGTSVTATRPWPAIALEDKPQDWFEALFKEVDTTIIGERFRGGNTDVSPLSFVFLPLIQEQIFLKYLESVKTIQRRDVIDAYITACFGAWLDYQNLSGDKKITTANAPDLLMQPESIESFFKIYPEGRLISVVRNPEDWLAYASTHEPEIYENTGGAVTRWKESVRVAMEINRKYKDRVCLIRFEDLIDHTGDIMRQVSAFLEISFEEILLSPTFNSIPLLHSKTPKAEGADATFGYFTVSRELTEDQQKLVEKMMKEDYQKISEDVIAR